MLNYIGLVILQQVIACDKHGLSKTNIYCPDTSSNQRLELLFDPKTCSSKENRDYYESRTSRLEDLANGFSNIYYPTIRDSLMIESCCQEQFDQNNCNEQIRNLNRSIGWTKSVKIDFATAFYFNHNFISILIKTSHLRRDFQGTVTLTVDMDKSSCGHSFFARRSFSVSPSLRPDVYFSFSDPKMPKNCDAIVYLQVPCPGNPTDVFQSTKDCDSEYNRESNEINGHLMAYHNKQDASILPGRDSIQPPGHRLLNEVINTDNNLKYYINSETNDIKLKILPREAHSMKIYSSSNGEISCEARGFPPPSIKLTSSASRASPSCSTCGWDCTKCDWSLKSEPTVCDSETELYCRARTNSSSKYIKSLPLQQPEFGSIYAAKKTSEVSIFGSVGGGEAVIEFRIPLTNWQIKRSCYDLQNPSKDKKLKRLLSNILKKVSWHRGSMDFGCGRKYENIRLDDSCRNSEQCEVIVSLHIFNPTEDDAGYYKMSLPELGLESTLHELIVNTDETEFIKSVNNTDVDAIEELLRSNKFESFQLETKFKIHSCKAFDGRNVRCLWWPMYRQIQRTLGTFSIQFFRIDQCPLIKHLDNRENDFRRVTTFLPTNYKPLDKDAPGQMEFVESNLLPGAKYQVMICGWDCASERECYKRNEDEAKRVTGFGQRFCKIATVEMPMEAPIEFAIDTEELKYEPRVLNSTTKWTRSLDFRLSTRITDALYPSIDGFEAICAVNNTKFMSDRRSELIKFVTPSIGNYAHVDFLPPGTTFEVDFRFFNAYGFGPVKSDYIDRTKFKEPRRPRQSAYTQPIGGAMPPDAANEADFYLENVTNNRGNVSFILMKFGDLAKQQMPKLSEKTVVQSSGEKTSIFLYNYLLGTIVSTRIEDFTDQLRDELPPPAILSAHRSRLGLSVTVAPRLFYTARETMTFVQIARYPLSYTLNKLYPTTNEEKVVDNKFYLDFKKDCEKIPELCDKEVRLTFYTACWDAKSWSYKKLSRDSPTILLTNQNVADFKSDIIQKNLKPPSIKVATLTTTKYQKRLGIGYVVEPKHAIGYAYGIEFQFADQFQEQRPCVEMADFKNINYESTVVDFMLPRQHYESTMENGNESEGYNMDFVKMLSYCESGNEYDQVCSHQNRVRFGGGMDGLNITATNLINIRQANHHPWLDNGLFEPPIDTCSMCVRARLVYRQASGTGHPGNEDGCISTKAGCKGVWSDGQHYEHRLQRNCDRGPQDKISYKILSQISKPNPEEPNEPTSDKTTTASENPPMLTNSTESDWMESQSVTYILSSIIVCLLLLLLFCCYHKYYRRRRHPQYHGHGRLDLAKACSRSDTSLSRESYEYSEVNINQPIISRSEAPTLPRELNTLLMTSSAHVTDGRNDETDSGCSSMPGDNSV